MALLDIVAPCVAGLALLGTATAAAAGQPGAGEPSTVPEPAAEEPAGDTGGQADASLGADAEADASADADADGSYDGDLFEAEASADSSAAAVESDSADSAVAPADPAVESSLSSTGGISPFKGRFGLGAIRTLRGLTGINARYFVLDRLSIGASAGVALFAYKENDPASTDPPCPDEECVLEDTRTVAAMSFNVEALYWAKLGREAGQLPFRADFGIGGRFGVTSVVNATDAPDNLDDPTILDIEVPIVFQLMFGNNFVLAPELGMAFEIVPGSREAGDTNPGRATPNFISGDAANGPGFGWILAPGVGLFAGVSMHYYFGK